MSIPHAPEDLGSDFPDKAQVPQETSGAAPLATAAVRQELGQETPPNPTSRSQGENGSNASPTNFDVHPEGVPKRNVYGTPLDVAAKTTREDGVPLLGSQSRPGPEPKSEQSFWKRFRTPLIAGATALAAVGATIIVLNPFAKKETTDTENAGATPPAATAGSLGVDAPKTSSINTGANTATIQAQPTAEAPVTTEHRDGQGAGDPQGTQEALPSNLTGTIDPNKADSAFSPESTKTVKATVNGEQVTAHTLPVMSPNASPSELANYFNRLMELRSLAFTIYLEDPNSPDFNVVMGAWTDSPTVYTQFVEEAQKLQAQIPVGSKPVVSIHDGADMPAEFQIGIPANNGKGGFDLVDTQTGAIYISSQEGSGGIVVDVLDADTYRWGEVPPQGVEPLARQILVGVRASQYNDTANGTSAIKYFRSDTFNPGS